MACRMNLTSAGMRRLVHRTSFLLCIVCLSMIPIGILVKATEFGTMPEHYLSGGFVYAWVFAIINHFTRVPIRAGSLFNLKLPDHDT